MICCSGDLEMIFFMGPTAMINCLEKKVEHDAFTHLNA